jgi:hypothetical protein
VAFGWRRPLNLLLALVSWGLYGSYVAGLGFNIFFVNNASTSYVMLLRMMVVVKCMQQRDMNNHSKLEMVSVIRGLRMHVVI